MAPQKFSNFRSPDPSTPTADRPCHLVPIRATLIRGLIGEQIAERYFCSLGYRLVARNWRHRASGRMGEIDRVFVDGDVVVFVEVKSRFSRAERHEAKYKDGTISADSGSQLRPHPLVFESIDEEKIERLRWLSLAFFHAKGVSPKQDEVRYRFDLCGVTFYGSQGWKPECEHVSDLLRRYG